jgi:hypothetical protein
MSPESVQAAGLLDHLRLIRWLLGHSDKVPVLIGYLDAFKSATTVRDKWREGVRPSGDLLVDVIDTLPMYEDNGVLFFQAETAIVAQAAVEGQAAALGVDWSKLVELATTLLPIVLEQLLKLRK